MIVKMFQPRFAALVEAGTKRQTVRPTPKRMPKVGDLISLRAWTGLPYRSKQRVLKEAVVERVEQIRIAELSDRLRINLGGYSLVYDQVESIARADGFESQQAMRRWFVDQHGLPFEGIWIRWKS